MNREETAGGTERREWEDAECGGDRFSQGGAAAQYDSGVLEELQAHRFLRHRGLARQRQAGTGVRAIFHDWQRLGHVPPVIRSDEARRKWAGE